MAFKKFTNYTRSGPREKMSIRFTGGVAYLSAGFIRAATDVLRKSGSLDEDQKVSFVELFFDGDTGRVGVKPIGHRGLNSGDVKKRPGVRAITGTRTKSVSVRGFQEDCGIEDQTSLVLVPETHQNNSLPEGERQFILFVSSPSDDSGD